MPKITLNTILDRGKFKGRPLKEMIDTTGYYAFKSWYKQYPDMFAPDVHTYAKEIALKIYQNH